MDVQAQPRALSQHAASKAATGAAAGSSVKSRPCSLLDAVLGPGVVHDLHGGDELSGFAGRGVWGGVGGAGGNAGVQVADAEVFQQYGISQVVLEGPVVNTSITGPAAAVALMLLHLKTGDADVAARFKVWCMCGGAAGTEAGLLSCGCAPWRALHVLLRAVPVLC